MGFGGAVGRLDQRKGTQVVLARGIRRPPFKKPRKEMGVGVQNRLLRDMPTRIGPKLRRPWGG